MIKDEQDYLQSLRVRLCSVKSAFGPLDHRVQNSPTEKCLIMSCFEMSFQIQSKNRTEAGIISSPYPFINCYIYLKKVSIFNFVMCL